MKIIILGADTVGSTLAEHLASDNDITLVDPNQSRLRELREHIDIRTIQGLGSRPEILKQAGAEDADILIAMTDQDEVNMVACQIAYTLFQTPTKIARIRSQEYLSYQELFKTEALPIDVLISPEQLVTNNVKRLIEHPGALQVLEFANGKVKLVAMRAYYNGPLVGRSLKTLREHIPNVDTKIVAIYRHGQPIMPNADSIIEVNDEVFIIVPSEHAKTVMSELRQQEKPYKRIMIAGGGNIGLRLAQILENDYQVKIVEHNTRRTHVICESLNKTLVLHGDVADQQLLLNENIEDTDVFCAVTNDDEANILASLLAKRMGARKVMALINRAAYVNLIQGSNVDIAISPQQATISGVLSYMRLGDVVKDYSLRHGAAEAIEAIAHGDEKTSKVIGRRVGEIQLPAGTTIGAIVREEQVFIGHDEVVIEPEDHVVLFLIDKRFIHDVEALFQVSLSYF